MDYRKKKTKISKTSDGGGGDIGSGDTSSSTANATFFSYSTAHNTNSDDTDSAIQDEKDGTTTDPLVSYCHQDSDHRMMTEQQESSSSAASSSVIDESATATATATEVDDGMVVAPWSAYASTCFRELRDEAKEEARCKKLVLQQKPKDKPKRPLCAYNIFFQEERQRIVGSSTDGENTKSNNDPINSTDPGVTTDDQQDTSSSSFDSTTTMTGFESLAKQVGSRWQALVAATGNSDGDETANAKLLVFQKKAKLDMHRYLREMEIWKLTNNKKMKITRRYGGGGSSSSSQTRKTKKKKSSIRRIRAGRNERNTKTNKKNNSNSNNNNSTIGLSSKSDGHHPCSLDHHDDVQHYKKHQQQGRKSTGEDYITTIVATRKSFNWPSLDPDLTECTSDNEHELIVQAV